MGFIPLPSPLIPQSDALAAITKIIVFPFQGFLVMAANVTLSGCSVYEWMQSAIRSTRRPNDRSIP